jgi:hypothetical protein
VGSFPGERVVRFNARGPDTLMEGKAPGQRPKLNEAQHEALVAIVESRPAPEIHGVVRWRMIDQPARIMSIGRRQRAQEFRGGAAGYYTAAIMASQVMPAMKVCVVHDPNAACWGMARNPAQTALHALRVPGRSERVDEVRHPRQRVAEQRKRAARRPPLILSLMVCSDRPVFGCPALRGDQRPRDTQQHPCGSGQGDCREFEGVALITSAGVTA